MLSTALSSFPFSLGSSRHAGLNVCKTVTTSTLLYDFVSVPCTSFHKSAVLWIVHVAGRELTQKGLKSTPTKSESLGTSEEAPVGALPTSSSIARRSRRRRPKAKPQCIAM